MMTRRIDTDRRRFLKGMGVCLALPGLDCLGDTSREAPRRLVAINIPLGFHPPLFFPTETGENYRPSPYLEAADHLRQRYTVISGLSHPGVDGGHSAEKSFLTGAPHPGERGFRNTLSFDQAVAAKLGRTTRFASMVAGDHSLSWTASGVAIPREASPGKWFSRLFLSGSDAEIAAQRSQLADGHSILDAVLEETHSLRQLASRADQEKMDQFLTAVRETEERLTRTEQWLATPKPRVAAPNPGEVRSVNIDQWMNAHFQVQRLALMTDSTRVITFGGAGHGSVIPLPGVSMGYHGLSHHGKNPEMLRQLEVIERSILKAWAQFIESLAATAEGQGSLLDHTCVLLGSNLGNASGHLTTNLPVILAGGRFRHGRHLAFDSTNNLPLCNLFVSIMQDLGMETDRFASSTGTLRDLA